MTLVVDASAIAELLLGTPDGRAVGQMIGSEDLVAPAHLGAEVASVVRDWSLGGHLSDDRARTAFAEFRQLGVQQLPLDGLLELAWNLRHNLSAYDALYVVVARALGCQLLTLDRRLAAAAPDCALIPEGRGEGKRP